MRRTRRTTIALATAATLLIAACGSDDDSSVETTAAAPETTEAATETTEAAPETTEAAPETTEATETTEGEMAAGGFPECAALEGATIGYSQPLPDPNYELIGDIMSKQLAEAGMEYEGVNAQFDGNKQVADIQTLVQQGIAALIINPIDPTIVAGALQEVIDAGIPVIVENTDNPDGLYYTSVNGDVISAATAGAALIAETIGDGEVGVIEGPPFATILARSGAAFNAAAPELGLNIVQSQTAIPPNDPNVSRSIAEAWKQQYPDMKAIWTFNDRGATGVAAVIDDSWAPIIVSVNGEPDAIPLIEGGRILATYDVNTDILARGLAFAAASAICGEELPPEIWVPSDVIDSTNVADWVNPVDRPVDGGFELEERDGRIYIVAS